MLYLYVITPSSEQHLWYEYAFTTCINQDSPEEKKTDKIVR